MKTKKLTFLAAAVLCLALPAARAESPVIARVGNSDVRAEEIRPYLETLPPEQLEALAQNPAALSQIVRLILTQRLLLAEAQAAGHEKNPEFQEQLRRLKEAAIAESYLQAMTKLPEGYPSEADVRALYEARKEALVFPKAYNLSQIYIAVAEDAPKDKAAAAKEKIDKIAAELKAKDADFAKIARAHSEAVQNADQGGLVGWVTEENLQPKIRALVPKLAKGAVSDPIQLADGWYIVKVNDIRESRTAEFDEVRPQLEQALRAERLRLNREVYIQGLLRQNPISVDEINLPAVLKPAK